MIGVASSRPWHGVAFDEIERRLGLPVLRITRVSDLDKNNLDRSGVRRIFFLHWSSAIPSEIYQTIECIIFHMTALPYGRGGSPLQNLIVRGHKDTLLTAFRCVRELDAGPIYLQRPLNLDGPARQILQRATEMMIDMIEIIMRDNPYPVPQHGTPEVFKRRRQEEGNLQLADSIDLAYDLIRMLDAEGYPHAFLDTEDLHLEFTDVVRDGDSLRANVRILKK